MYAKNKLKKYYKNMKELERFMRYKLIQYQRSKTNKNTENTQENDISKWVMMKNHQPFKIDEKKLIII